MSKKTNEFDFTKANVEISFDEFKEMDISKSLANGVHRATNDLGVDEKARELFHNGRVTLDEDDYDMFLMAVRMCDVIAPAKKAALDILSNQ